MTEQTQLHQYLDSDLMLVRADMKSPKKLWQEMARLLAEPLRETSEENVEKNIYHCLLEREKIGNTGIGNGVALPHSRCIDTNRAVIAVITLQQAIDYDSPDGQPVDLAFGLIVPQQATQEHLNLLADIARLMSHGDNKQQLVAAQSGQQIIDLIEHWSVQPA